MSRQRIDGAGRDGRSGWVDGAGNGTAHRHHENAVQLVLRGQREDIKRAGDSPQPLIVEKEEHLLVDDGAAEVAAILVAMGSGLYERHRSAGAADGGGLKEAGRVQIGVAEELIERGMEFVAARFRCDVDGRARTAPVLRALVVGDHAELRNRVRRDRDDLIVEALVRLAVGVVVHAVQQEIIEDRTLAVDVVRALADQAVDVAGSGGLRRRLAHAGHQAQQVRVVSIHQRQGFRLVIGDGLIALTRLGFYLQGNVGDFDCSLGRAHLQAQVDALAVADRDGNVLRDRFREARRACRNAIHADAQLRRIVVAGSISLDKAADAGRCIDDRNVRAGNRRSCGVTDSSHNTGILVLSVELARRNQEQNHANSEKNWREAIA